MSTFREKCLYAPYISIERESKVEIKRQRNTARPSLHLSLIGLEGRGVTGARE